MKKFVAITTPGAEFMYRANTAHYVSRDNARRILDAYITICSSLHSI